MLVLRMLVLEMVVDMVIFVLGLVLVFSGVCLWWWCWCSRTRKSAGNSCDMDIAARLPGVARGRRDFQTSRFFCTGPGL